MEANRPFRWDLIRPDLMRGRPTVFVDLLGREPAISERWLRDLQVSLRR